MNLETLQKEIEKLSVSEQQILADSLMKKLKKQPNGKTLNLAFLHGELWTESLEDDLSENHDDYLYE